MKSLGPRLIRIGICAALSAGAAAAQPPDTTTAPSPDRPQVATPRIQKAIVVTGSRTRQLIHEAPAPMSVITAQEITTAPAAHYGDLLRNVPGLSVTQIGARDIQIVGRGSGGTLVNTQLVVVDGRSINLDFFGFVMWDFLPVDPHEIRQIEVLRGAGSAVWGASAQSGVVNVITKSPKEMLGTSLALGGGELNTGFARLSHAAMTGNLEYKVSVSGSRQDPYHRPMGTVPGTTTPYPDFPNKGTTQPKVDVRVDHDASDGSTWSLSGGYAGTDGILHSGIGPFDIDAGTFLSYGRAEYQSGALRLAFFTNILDGDATNLLTRDASGKPISFSFGTQTYSLDFGNSTPVGDRNVLTYGANARRSNFNITLAPRGKNRDEVGAFIQDQLLLSAAVRLVAGARWDNLEPIGSVFSPRTALLYMPHRDHTLRVSYNRAFRAPSVINNFIETSIVNQIPLPTGPFSFPSRIAGNPDLGKAWSDAIEAGWVGTFMDRASVGFGVYRSHYHESIDFYPATFYSPSNPPPGWPSPPGPGAVPPNTLPESFTYRNLGQTTFQGVEAFLQYVASPRWSGYANYTYTDDPEVKDINRDEIGTPSKHRCNVGLGYDDRKIFASGNLNYVGEAFWVDVLDSRFWGPTKAFTQVNLAAGVRLMNDRVTLSVLATNVFDARAQQHVFGDIISRRVLGELRLHLR